VPHTNRPGIRLLLGATAAATCLCVFARASTAPAANCDSTSKGFTPISDLGSGTYQGFEGGLYPGGANAPPATHLAAGVDEALAVEPLDAAGLPDPVSGSIVLLSIGMSNTSQEFSTFGPLVAAYPGHNPRLVVINGAQGGQTASAVSDSNAAFWDVIDQRLASAGMTRLQVQALWFKEANAGPTEPFPTHADSLRAQFLRIVRIARALYPNARLCYMSSRTYAGYASSPLNPEPYAYESGFAVKWLIESQIAGNDSLNFDPDSGAVVAPWLAWGPYLWADGIVPRSDGLVWLCDDFLASDGTHPSTSGRTKVANMLLGFFAGDTTAAPWFLGNATGTESPPVAAPGFFVHAARPNPYAERTSIGVETIESLPVRVDVVTPSGRRLKTIADATLRPGRWDFAWDGTDGEGRRVGSGVYFLRVRGGDTVRSDRVTLAR
jgi:hypothetical protein